MDGKTQAILARRQLEHGDCLSQRTFRVRHTVQDRGFVAGAGPGADGGNVGGFSEGEAEALPALAVILDWDIME